MSQELERRVCERITERQDELVELLRTLIGFDTTAHVPGALARDEAALQDHLAARLRAAGARVQVAEPDPAVYSGHRMIPEGFDFMVAHSWWPGLPGPGAAARSCSAATSTSWMSSREMLGRTHRLPPRSAPAGSTVAAPAT